MSLSTDFVKPQGPRASGDHDFVDASARDHEFRQGIDKRLLDVVAGTALAVAAVPLIAVLALAVCVSLRTWRPFFRQRRVGRHGRPLTVVKLRTLPLDVPPALDKYALQGVRTTRLARFLRCTHLDELPQLLLVPIGRMSLVGPRPEMLWLSATFDPEFAAVRAAVRPGCTGLWQIGAAAGRLIGEAPEYDLHYLHHMSARLDVWILWRSLLVMAGGRRVSCADVPRWATGVAGGVLGDARHVGKRRKVLGIFRKYSRSSLRMGRHKPPTGEPLLPDLAAFVAARPITRETAR